jgi:hypothetical protein
MLRPAFLNSLEVSGAARPLTPGPRRGALLVPAPARPARRARRARLRSLGHAYHGTISVSPEGACDLRCKEPIRNCRGRPCPTWNLKRSLQGANLVNSPI